jgi:hypothetical protein
MASMALVAEVWLSRLWSTTMVGTGERRSSVACDTPVTTTCPISVAAVVSFSSRGWPLPVSTTWFTVL